jgi:hypothetical protein
LIEGILSKMTFETKFVGSSILVRVFCPTPCDSTVANISVLFTAPGARAIIEAFL